MAKRGNGEGSISKRSGGGWMAQYYVLSGTGGRERGTLYARTRTEAARKLARAIGERDTGFVVDAGKLTVEDSALTVLADLLVDVAVAEHHDADPSNSPLGRRGAAQAAALRVNSGSRPDTGELIRRQNLIAEFPWFSQVAVLREMRGAHPAPIGSTDPVRLGDEAENDVRFFECYWA